MILIEGPDLTGKTTLAKTIVSRLNELGWPHLYSHLSKPPDCWREDPLRCYRQLLRPHVVQDRMHLSGCAYRYADGGPTHLSVSEFGQIDRELHNYGGHVLLITADEPIIRMRHANHRAREMYDVDVVLKANEWFLKYAQRETAQRGRVASHVHLTLSRPWATVEDASLRTYLGRLAQDYDYRGGVLP